MIGNYFFSSTGAAAYEIDQSLRFDGGAQLTRTPSSASNQKTWTISCWVKYVIPSGEGVLWMAGPGAYEKAAFKAGTPHDLLWGAYTHPNLHFRLWTNQQFRDPAAWFHCVFVSDTDNGTAADRKRLYINGERVTSWQEQTNPNQSFGGYWNSTNTHRIGADSNPFYFNGYVAEFHSVDGTALDPTDFGEFDDNGVWRPIEYTGGSYGTNGFYLKFDPTATNGIGHDHSGNGNNWTASGFTTTGDRTDVVTDTPTDNHCTLNPIEETEPGYESDFEFSEGNLKIVFPSSPPTDHVCGTLCSTGAWYAEVECISVTRNANVNVLEPGAMGFVGSRPGVRTNPPSGYSYSNSGIINHNATEYTGAASWTAGDVIGVACNVDGNSLRFYKNGVLQKTFTTTRTEPMTIGCDGTDGSGNSSSFFINCGQQPYQYTPPTGHTALSTKNIPAPAIADGSQYFQTVLWDGNGATSRNITTNFSPDWAIIKQRDDIYGFGTYDNVRGGGKFLRTDSTDSETTNPADGYVSAFNSTSVTLAKGSYGWNVNGSGYSYVGWFWDGGGTGSSNTSGTITSTVSANTTAGFSIVSYTGTGSAGTVGHGLGVAPAVIWVKNRDSSAAYWPVYHHKIHQTSAPATLHLELNSTAARATSDFWNSTAPTSTVFSVKDSNKVNSSGDDFIAYCFAEVEGYSKFGSYTGNGSTNGPFVYCGFKPSWILYRQAESTSNWFLYDAARSPANGDGIDKYFTINNATAENNDGAYNTTEDFDFLSNGFKVRDNGGSVNASGGHFIFMCFASNPFGGSGVSPATAR